MGLYTRYHNRKQYNLKKELHCKVQVLKPLENCGNPRPQQRNASRKTAPLRPAKRRCAALSVPLNLPSFIWLFLQIGGSRLWVSLKEEPYYLGSRLGPLICGNSHIENAMSGRCPVLSLGSYGKWFISLAAIICTPIMPLGRHDCTHQSIIKTMTYMNVVPKSAIPDRVTGLAISEWSKLVPELLLHHSTVPELTLTPPLNSQNTGLHLHLPLYLYLYPPFKEPFRSL